MVLTMHFKFEWEIIVLFVIMLIWESFNYGIGVKTI